MTAGDAMTVSQLIQARFDRLAAVGSAEGEDLYSPHALNVLASGSDVGRSPNSPIALAAIGGVLLAGRMRIAGTSRGSSTQMRRLTSALRRWSLDILDRL
jgi:hypothetical protein